MLFKGINYDVGTEFRKGKLSRNEFDESVIKKEIQIIKNELNCDLIRISGLDIARLFKASRFALESGLQVWFSPAHVDATQEEVKKYLIDCSKAAEELRENYEKVIFVAGCEYSLFLKGFIKGENIYDRMKQMFNPLMFIANRLGFRKKIYNDLNIFLTGAVSKIKENFKGKISYASGTWEKINWDLFDYIGIDHYRASYNKSTYLKELRNYYRFNKPVAVLEFGCCTYKGAQDKGGAGWAITEIENGKPVIKKGYIRDETVQSNYIIELLDIFKKENIYAAFVFTFINPAYKYNSNPKLDLDMASYGIVRPINNAEGTFYKELPWIPKEAFYRLAEYNR